MADSEKLEGSQIAESKTDVTEVLLPQTQLLQGEKLVADVKKFVTKQVKEQVEKQAQLDKASLMTIFGVFASLISFLTIEFQFLKTIQNPCSLVGFSLILFALLLSFNIGLDYLMKSRIEKYSPKPHWLFIISVTISFLVGGGCVYIGEFVCSKKTHFETNTTPICKNLQINTHRL